MAASEKQLTMCYRASSVSVRRAQSSANSSSVMSSSLVFVHARRLPKVEKTAVCLETDVDAVSYTHLTLPTMPDV